MSSEFKLFDTRVSSVNDTWDWNRGRLILYYSSNHLWGQSGSDNNGNVLFAETWIPPENATLDQADTVIEDSYTYDSLNRLTSVAEQRMTAAGGWVWNQQFQQSYNYDRWGNRTINPASWGTGINVKQFTVNTANNRLGVPVGQTGTMSYDAAGNLTNDTYTGAGNRTYDAENKITSAWGGNNQAQLYGYDASGQRIKRTVNGVETWQVYGLGGELVAEYAASGSPGSPQKEYGYRNGELLVTASLAGSDHSLSTNGTSAYVQGPSSSSLSIAGAITVEAWIKIDSIGAYRTIISKEAFQQTGTGGGYRLAITDLGKVRLDLFQSHNTYITAIGTATVTAGVWQHVAGVFDGSQIRLYLNGVLNGTLSTTSGPATGTGNFYLGRFSYSLNPYYFNGLIDEARVSNAALYTSNFTPANSLTASGSTKGLWKFNGQTTNDSSGNSNNGTLQGGAAYSSSVPGGGGNNLQLQWLVSDHLGTPRMILDQTGSLANMKRHDYLPFGEELIAPTGGRSAAQGYSGGDGLRQQFTSQERDIETQLDYYGARFYSSIQGRFVSPDEAFADQEEDQPQSWNLYTYVRNNPLRYVDPYGDAHWEVDKDGVSTYVGDYSGEYDKDLNATWDGSNWNFHENNGQDNTVVAGAEPAEQDQSAQMATGATIAFMVAPPPVKVGVVVGGAAGALIITGVVLFHEPVKIEVAPPPITYPRYVKPDKINIGPAPPPPPILRKRGERRLIRAAARRAGVSYIALKNAIHRYKRQMKMRGDENLTWEEILAIAAEIKKRWDNL